MGKLSGRVAIVTGAAGGFGRVLVHALLAEGAKVSAVDVNESGLVALARAAPARGKEGLLAKVTDISDYAACEAAVEDTIDRFGGLHILINNGALGMREIRDDHMVNLIAIQEITPQMWQRFVAVNFTGAWNMTRSTIGHLLNQRWGRIINVTTSFFRHAAGRLPPLRSVQAGLSLTSGHAKEFASTGVTVNIVVP